MEWLDQKTVLFVSALVCFAYVGMMLYLFLVVLNPQRKG